MAIDLIRFIAAFFMPEAVVVNAGYAVLINTPCRTGFTFEEVQVMTTICDLVSAVSDVADFCDYEVGYLFGDEIDEVNLEEALFNTANMTVNKTSKKEDKKPVTNVAPVSKGDISEKDYLEEISQLRSRLNEKEQENKYLRTVQNCKEVGRRSREPVKEV